MKKETFWTMDTESVVKEWMKTGDSTLWLNTVLPALRSFAGYVMSCYPEWWQWNSHVKKDIMQDMVTRVALNIHRYQPTKRTTLFGYIRLIMASELMQQFNRATGHYPQNGESIQANGKRNVTKNVSYELFVENGGSVAEVFRYNIYKDELFIRFICDWWKDFNFNRHDAKAKRRYVMFIIDILERPEMHRPVKGNYNKYICNHFGITKQRFSQICIWMKGFSNQIRHQYEYGNLLQKIIAER